MTFEQTNTELQTIGFESGSSLRNWVFIIFTFSLIGLLHLVVVLCFPKFKLEDDSTKCRKALNIGVKKLVAFFTFTLYIRTISESYQFLLLANISNVYEFDYSSPEKITALVFSIFMLVCLTIFTFLAFYTYYVSYNADYSDSRLKWEEFLGGIKASNNPRLYSFISLIRRFAMIVLLIWGELLGPQIVAIGLVVILIPYLLYLIAVRPFKETRNNIIEIINEIFLTIITAWLCYFNTESDWSNLITKTYMAIIIGNTLTITTIIFVCLFIKSVKSCKSKCWKKKERIMTKPTVTVIQVNNSQNISEPIPSVSFVRSVSKMNPAIIYKDKNLPEFYSKRMKKNI